MPLIHSKSDAAFKTNLKNLMGERGVSPHVKDAKQALAIAYATKRRGRADGGVANPVMSTPVLQIDPMAGPMLQQGGAGAAPTASVKLTPAETSYFGEMMKPQYGFKDEVPSAQLNGNTLKFAPEHAGPLLNFMDESRSLRDVGETLPPSFYNQQKFIGRASGLPDDFYIGSTTGKKRGGPAVGQAMKTAYGIKRAMGGNAFPSFKPPSSNPSFAVRGEAHNMMHVGPIMSSVPGRTDHHPLNVPASSYVLPADHVSSLGQGNTAAGMKILGNMFPGSSGGPYGAGSVNPVHGMGAPKPPRPMSDTGGARGEGRAGAVPILAAGGEFVISPSDVLRVGNGDAKHGHEVLDSWVKANRKKHISTLKGLPGPAKS